MSGRVGYIIAGLALAAGLVMAPVVLVQLLRAMPDRLQQVVVPGEHDLALTRTGAYTIFHETRAVVAGRFFATDRHLNGLRLRLDTIPPGDDIPIRPTSVRASYRLADRDGSSIATFEVARPGTYRLTAWYTKPAPETAAVLAIAQGVQRRMMTAVLASLGVGFAGFVASASIVTVTYRRNRESTGGRRQKTRG